MTEFVGYIEATMNTANFSATNNDYWAPLFAPQRKRVDRIRLYQLWNDNATIVFNQPYDITNYPVTKSPLASHGRGRIFNFDRGYLARVAWRLKIWNVYGRQHNVLFKNGNKISHPRELTHD